MNSIFVVTGKSGDYSDRRQWIIGYATSKKEAEAFVAKLTAVYVKDRAVWDETETYDFEKDFAATRLLDPGLGEWNDVKYCVEKINPLGVA